MTNHSLGYLKEEFVAATAMAPTGTAVAPAGTQLGITTLELLIVWVRWIRGQVCQGHDLHYRRFGELDKKYAADIAANKDAVAEGRYESIHLDAMCRMWDLKEQWCKLLDEIDAWFRVNKIQIDSDKQ